MSAKRGKQRISTHSGNTEEVPDMKTDMHIKTKSNIKKTGNERVGEDNTFVKCDARCKSWRLIARNLPFKVDTC